MHVLRSWVQIPPGPFLSVSELRYYFELDFNNCRTNSAAMPWINQIERSLWWNVWHF